MISQAMILAAGLGNRMRPMTDHQPKPMVPVNGKPIIGYTIDSLRSLGIDTIAANTHYKADRIEPYLKARNVGISYEPVLLDTGGGIKNALSHFDRNRPLLVVSGDSILVGDDGLRGLMRDWDGNKMDLNLLLQPLNTMIITPGVGDYDIMNGKPVRRADQSGQYMWTSARILNPSIFNQIAEEKFSFLPLMDTAQNNNRLGATIHAGIWHHITTPVDVKAVESAQ